jgi:ferredoxin-NADP reductase
MSPTVRSLTFRVQDGEDFCFEPGQWVSLSLPVAGERMIRAYSIASPPRDDNTFDLAVTHVPAGEASEYLGTLAPGAQLRFTGPFGTFLIREPVNRPIYLVATGTGVAPFRSMLFDLLERRRVAKDIYLIFGVRTEADILYRGEFEDRARHHPNFHFVPTLSRPGEGWPGASGYVQSASEPLLLPRRDADVYVCGVRKMVNDMRHCLKQWGYDRRQVHYERYD